MDNLFNLGVAISKGDPIANSAISTALARKNDPQTSKDAATKMVLTGELSRQEQMVYQSICDLCHTYPKYWKGFTTKDVAHQIDRYSPKYLYDKAYEICRRRFSGLSNKFKIVLTGERRAGCRVWKLI